MEPNFQTSFIPKKPMIEERVVKPHSIGFFTVISLFFFFAVLIGSGGLYFYKTLIKKNITQMETDLNLAKASFEPSKILQLQVLDKRLNASTDILAKHAVISPIFQILQNITMKSVQYTKFTHEFTPDGKLAVTMTGKATGYKSIALQSDLFANHISLLDPLFSNLVLDDLGNVSFDLNFSVDPSLVNYKHMLDEATRSIQSQGEPVSQAPVTEAELQQLEELENMINDLEINEVNE